MTRPFAVIGFSFLTVLFFAMTLNILHPLYINVVLLLLLITSVCIKKTRKAKVIPVAVMTAIVALSLYSFKFDAMIKPTTLLNDTDLNISGVICEVPYKTHNKFYYILDTDLRSMGAVNKSTKIKVSTSTPLDADVFDNVRCDVHIFAPENKGILSQRSHMFAKGINFVGYINEHESFPVVTKDDRVFVPQKWILKLRMAISKSIRVLLPDEMSSVATGMLLGDKYSMDDSVKANFRNLGITHLLAVSGLHTAVIAKAFQTVFILMGLRKKISSLLSCFGIFLFMSVSGFSSSVVRAGIMLIIFLIGEAVGRRADSINSLGFAVLFILAVNPLAVGDLGLLLSFFATLGIILFEAPIRNKIKLPNFIAATISVTTSATILTLPVIMISFGRISLMSVISNFLVVTPSMVMIPCILIASVFSFFKFFYFVSYFFSFIAGLLIKYVVGCSSFLSKFSSLSINIAEPYMILCLTFTLLLFGICFIIKQKNTILLKTTSILCLNMFLLAFLSNQIVNRNVVSLAVVDAGKGCSIVLSKNGHAAILSCGGSKGKSERLFEYLDSKNVQSVDYMLISSYDNNTCSYADMVMQKYDVKTVLLSGNEKRENKITDSLFRESNTYMFDDEVSTSLWGNVKITAVEERNKGFVKLDVNDVQTLICSGGGDVANLKEDFCSCDFFITGKNPENFEKLKFMYSIVSSDAEGADAMTKQILNKNKTPFITGGNGNVVVDFVKTDQVSIKRGI